MPWYTYVCEKCGEMVQQKTSLAHREVMPVHRGGGGCGDGRLRRVQPAPIEVPLMPFPRPTYTLM
jgi:predicted nucleic acid-binding Zn ribbon protein